jgi:hypothetical protein
MPINGTCPHCQGTFPLELALAEADHRRALAAALAVPAPLARLVVPYMNLHAPAGRNIARRKLTRLLRELSDGVTSGQITRNGVSYACPLEAWKAGLEAVLLAHEAGTLVVPLEGHGYLVKVLWTAAAKAAGHAERQVEDGKRHRAHRASSGGLRPVGERLSGEALGQALEGLKSAAKGASNRASEDKNG